MIGRSNPGFLLGLRGWCIEICGGWIGARVSKLLKVFQRFCILVTYKERATDVNLLSESEAALCNMHSGKKGSIYLPRRPDCCIENPGELTDDVGPVGA